VVSWTRLASGEPGRGVSLHFMRYNVARPHQTLTKAAGAPTTPAMAAAVADHVWTLTDIVALLDVTADST
jgi:hypothetical protein